ncbi:sugar transferase [Nocardioides lijunqiniae]|uniref:sugar transferase n=1 Tax=Nocardioides lijunqiniae TaxID=2760832 RepID=UPI001877F969|nr:sugar transferase [Nocardioides lijunqiniae]
MPYDRLKRAIDLMTAGFLGILTAPLQLAIAALIRMRLGSPVLFRQERPGKDERIFELVKFRTMLAPDEARGLVDDADRMTRLGAVLRSTSLDELPTLWNVAKGDMSLVGPRPLLVRYLDRYSPEQRRRHDVRPGITGLAQVNGRNSLTWEQKFKYDIEYVHNRSFSLDARILLMTVLRVVRRHGISASDSVTMPEYEGSR